MRAALILVTLAWLATPALATPTQELDQARAAFRTGQFQVAQQAYNDLLYPTPRLASSDDLAEAYIGLGVCRLENGDPDGAKREFEKALALDPNRQLDPLLITNKQAIRLFDDTKADITGRAEREKERKALAEQREKYREALKNLRVVEVHSYGINFFPPAGQIQNKEYLRGALFATGEAITGGTSLGIYLYLADKYGINCPHCVAAGDASTVRLYQQIEIGAGLAFIGLYIGGVVDSLVHYKPRAEIKGDESLLRDQLPPELRPKPKKSSLLDRVHVVPMVTPTGVGLGLGLEN